MDPSSALGFPLTIQCHCWNRRTCYPAAEFPKSAMNATATTATLNKYLRLNGRQGRQDAAHERSPGKSECGLHDEILLTVVQTYTSRNDDS